MRDTNAVFLLMTGYRTVFDTDAPPKPVWYVDDVNKTLPGCVYPGASPAMNAVAMFRLTAPVWAGPHKHFEPVTI